MKISISILMTILFSCHITNSLKVESRNDDMEIMAIKCIMEHMFPMQKDQKKSNTIFVDNKMLPMHDRWQYILGSIKDNCSFCRAYKNKEYNITQLQDMKISTNVQLWDYKLQGYNGGNYIKFSPLISTKNPDLFCIYTEYDTSFSESTNAFIYLMVREKDGKFRFLTDLNGIVIFQ